MQQDMGTAIEKLARDFQANSAPGATPQMRLAFAATCVGTSSRRTLTSIEVKP